MKFPDNIPVETFLKDYWQQKPLLIRNAFDSDFFPLNADELAGLALESAEDAELESRIVLEHGKMPWELLHGPFSETDFSNLPPTHWTLLVQDIDKYVPQIRSLLADFSFIPDWRIDDIMVSYATDKGSVGPHVDSYDVFLIQAEGNRRWQVGAVDDLQAGYLNDIDLQIMKQFSTESEWLLEPGDLLYLPPGIPHWGISEGECITCSVGFRAPSRQEILEDLTQHLLDSGMGKGHYQDPSLHTQKHSGEIGADVFDRVSKIIDSFKMLPAQQQRWFGQLVTRNKAHLEISPDVDPVDNATLLSRIKADEQLIPHPFSRFAFTKIDTGTLTLFACGESFDLSIDKLSVAEKICDIEQSPLNLSPDDYEDPAIISLLVQLYNLGYILFDD